MKTPKEDPDDKRERERQKREALLDRRRAAEKGASSLTQDIANVYGFGGLNRGATPSSIFK